MNTMSSKYPQLPDWHQVESLFAGIFARQYYTEHGPLVQELEKRLEHQLGFDHVVCVCSEFVAYAELLNLLDPKGEVVLCGSNTAVARQAMGWFDKQLPVLLTPHSACSAQIISETVSNATAAVVLTGECADESLVIQLRERLQDKPVRIIMDVTHNPLQPAGEADIHVCSMSGDARLSAVQGAYIATQLAELAHPLRNMRSSSGVSQLAAVARTVNGRLSEAHAGWALMTLSERFPHT